MTEWKSTPKGPWAIPNLKNWITWLCVTRTLMCRKESPPDTYTLNVKVVQLELSSRAISSGRASFLDLLFGSVEGISSYFI